jgi:hypothetical protein
MGRYYCGTHQVPSSKKPHHCRWRWKKQGFSSHRSCLHGSREEALRCLGQYLGFQSTRPDKEHGTGPDVLWSFSEQAAFCVDVKSDKECGSVYRKDEFGQLSDHVQWVRDNTEATEITPAFIGPEVAPSDTANPPHGVKVATLEKMHAIGETLKRAYRDVAASALPISLARAVNDELAKRELLWPQLERSMGLREVRDL